MNFQGIGICSGIRKGVLWSFHSEQSFVNQQGNITHRNEVDQNMPAVKYQKLFDKESSNIEKEHGTECFDDENKVIQQELEYVTTAFTNVIHNYEMISKIAFDKVGRAAALIVEGHRLMASDQELLRKISHLISSCRVTAEYAIWSTLNEYIELMKHEDNTYLRARSYDFLHLLRALITEIKNIKMLGIDSKSVDVKQKEINQGCTSIAMGDDFGVEDLILLSEQGVVGVIDFLGEEEGHVAVIAKSLGLPMIIQMDPLLMKLEGKEVWMDGTTGSVYTE